MFFTPLKRCLGILALLAATSAPAFAYVVNFDTAFDIVYDSATYTEQGIGLTPAGGDALIADSSCDPASEFCAIGNSTSFLTALNGAQVTVARTDGSAFDLVSFDASFAPITDVDFSGETIWMELNGTVAGGGTVFQIFLLPANDGSGDFPFGTYSFPSFRNLESMTFSACFDDALEGFCSSTRSAQFALDNLNFDNPSSVPEPGMAMLIVLGLGALALTRRRSIGS